MGAGGRAGLNQRGRASSTQHEMVCTIVPIATPPQTVPSAMDPAGNKQQVGFRLAGDDVVADKFIAVASKLTGLLKELEASMTGEQDVEWQIVDLQVGSASFAVAPHLRPSTSAATATAVIGAALEGLATVEDTVRRPPHFTDQVLRSAKSLVNAKKDETNALAVFGRVDGAHRQVTLSSHLVAHVDELIGTASVAVGSLEGTLEAVTIHDTVAFSIYDAITNRRVECKCDRETLDLAIGQHFGKRVSVGGLVSYNVQGDATSIRVKDVRALGNAHLPQAKDIRGLFSDHKVDIDEWARFVRED